MEIPEKLLFLFSPRFWFVVMGAASFVLQDPETATRPWYVTVGKFLGIVSAGTVGIGTVDRLGKNIGKTEVQAKEDIKQKTEDEIPTTDPNDVV